MSNDEGRSNERMTNGSAAPLIFRALSFVIDSSLIIRASSLSSRVSQHFFDGRVACEDAAQTVLAQRDHSKLDCLLFYCNSWRSLVDQFANRITNLQKLVNAFSSLVAGIIASVATFPVEEWLLANVAARDAELRQQRVIRPVRGAAMCTDATQQALTEHGFQRRRNKERLDAHIKQTRNGPGRIVRMQRRKNQMSRERCLDGNLCRLKIACFANHDAVWVLAQKVPQNACESQLDRFIYRHLHDPFQIVFHRFLPSDELRIDRVDLAQT